MFTSGTQRRQQGTWIGETWISKHQKHFATREEAREWSGSRGRQYEARRTTTSDPEPYVHEDGKRYARSRVVIGGFTRAGFFDPRPEFAVHDNEILDSFREYAEMDADRSATVEEWLHCEEEDNLDEFGDSLIDRALEWSNPATWDAQREHAYRVLTRLASLSKN